MIDYSDFDSLNNYFEDIVSDDNFEGNYFDYELTENDFDYIFNSLFPEYIENGQGLSTIDYIKDCLRQSLEDNNYEDIFEISKQLSEKANDACEYVEDIHYWNFYYSLNELDPILRQDINKYFKEFIMRWKQNNS